MVARRSQVALDVQRSSAMKQTTRAKLSLDRQTLRRLAPAALAAVVGGADGAPPTTIGKQEPHPNPW